MSCILIFNVACYFGVLSSHYLKGFQIPIDNLHCNTYGVITSACIVFLQIREETDTKIDLPNENSESDVIVITGKKENVLKARDKIELIQKELVSYVKI